MYPKKQIIKKNTWAWKFFQTQQSRFLFCQTIMRDIFAQSWCDELYLELVYCLRWLRSKMSDRFALIRADARRITGGAHQRDALFPTCIRTFYQMISAWMNYFIFASSLFKTFQQIIWEIQQGRKTVQHHKNAQKYSQTFKFDLDIENFWNKGTNSIDSAQKLRNTYKTILLLKFRSSKGPTCTIHKINLSILFCHLY